MSALTTTPLEQISAHDALVDRLVSDLALGRVHSVAFVVPSDAFWTLPLYDVAITTARRGWTLGIDGVRYWFVTPEPEPLAGLGAAAVVAADQRLEPEGITFIGSTYADIRPGLVLLDPQGESLEVDLIVSLRHRGGFDVQPRSLGDRHRIRRQPADHPHPPAVDDAAQPGAVQGALRAPRLRSSHARLPRARGRGSRRCARTRCRSPTSACPAPADTRAPAVELERFRPAGDASASHWQVYTADWRALPEEALLGRETLDVVKRAIEELPWRSGA